MWVLQFFQYGHYFFWGEGEGAGVWESAFAPNFKTVQ